MGDEKITGILGKKPLSLEELKSLKEKRESAGVSSYHFKAANSADRYYDFIESRVTLLQNDGINNPINILYEVENAKKTGDLSNATIQEIKAMIKRQKDFANSVPQIIENFNFKHKIKDSVNPELIKILEEIGTEKDTGKAKFLLSRKEILEALTKKIEDQNTKVNDSTNKEDKEINEDILLNLDGIKRYITKGFTENDAPVLAQTIMRWLNELKNNNSAPCELPKPFYGDELKHWFSADYSYGETLYHSLTDLEKSLENKNATINQQTIEELMHHRAMIHKYLIKTDEQKKSKINLYGLDDFINSYKTFDGNKEDKSTSLLTNMARAIEHLFKTQDIRLESTGIKTVKSWDEVKERPQWDKNINLLAMSSQKTEGYITDFLELLEVFEQSTSLGETIEKLSSKNNSIFLQSINFPKDAFNKKSDSPKFGLLISGEQQKGVFDFGVLSEKMIEPYWNKLTEGIDIKRKDSITAPSETELIEKVESLSKLIDAEREKHPDKIPEVIILLNAHSDATDDEMLPEPFNTFEGASEGHTLLKTENGKQILLSESRLKEILNPLAKKAKVYIILSTCKSAAFLSENEIKKTNNKIGNA